MKINDFIKNKFNELEKKGAKITEHIEDISDAVREEFDTICTNSVVQSRDVSEGETFAIAIAYVDENQKVDVFEYKYEIKKAQEEPKEDGSDDKTDDVEEQEEPKKDVPEDDREYSNE